jgi:hypothetical protein
MFVSKDYDHCVIGNYLKKKHNPLSQLIGKPEATAIYIAKADFDDLIMQALAAGAAGLRMYFASYCSTGYAPVDKISAAGFDKMMTLIFAPTDSTITDLGQYYIFNPGGGLVNIPKPIGSMLVAAYRGIKIPLLTAILTDCGKPKFTETHTMFLEIEKLHGPCGIIREMHCQNATGIAIFFGCYPIGFHLPGSSADVSWQMTVIFEFTRTVRYLGNTPYTYVFDVEDTDGYGGRKTANGEPAPTPTKFPTSVAGANTINPCPPSDKNCGSL